MENETPEIDGSIADLFEIFWRAYPRRVGKKEAFREFQRVGRSGEVSFEHLLNGVNAYTMMTIHTDIEYVAFPATWLRQGRWDDEVAPRWVQKQDVWVSKRSRASQENTLDT